MSTKARRKEKLEEFIGRTRGRKLVVLVGTKKALWMAVRRLDSTQRITMLKARLVSAARMG